MSVEVSPSGERRAFTRIPVEMWVEEHAGDGLTFRRSANLSRGGMSLDRTIPLPLGTMLTLSFTLPGDAAPVKVVAEIVSGGVSDDLGMGVKFVRLDEDSQARIDGYLARVAAGGADTGE